MKQKPKKQEPSGRKLRRGQQHPVSESEVDRISHLAPELMAHIFSYIPLKDAIRTSTLSRSWRDRWRTCLLRLHFVDCEKLRMSGNKWLSEEIVDAVLDAIRGPIDSFKVWMWAHDSNPCIQRWIHYAISHCVTSLDLWFNSTMISSCRLPESVFSCRSLKSLCLNSFAVQFPSGLQGFEQLTKLKLWGCILSPENELPRLITNSPCLTDLDVQNIIGCPDLEISSPSLLSISIFSICGDRLRLMNCPNLNRVSIIFCPLPMGHLVQGMDDIFLGPCNKIKELKFNCRLSDSGPVPERLPFELGQLCDLELALDLRLKVYLKLGFCIFRSSPSVRILTVKYFHTDDLQGDQERDSATNFWKGEEWQGLTLKGLTSARVVCESRKVATSQALLKFCKFIFANSPVLLDLTVFIRFEQLKTTAKNEILKALSVFPKASGNVKIRIERFLEKGGVLTAANACW